MSVGLEKIVEHRGFGSLVKAINSGGGIEVALRVAVAAGGGAVVAFFGWKIHKLVIMTAGAALGAGGGIFLSGFLPGLAPEWIWVIGSAFVGAGLAYGLFHAALALVGAAAGGFAGWWMMTWLAGNSNYAGYGAAVGIVVGGACALVLNRFFVTVFSSIVGACTIVAALLAALQKLAPGAAGTISANELVPSVWAAAIALVATWFQYRKLPSVTEREGRKKSGKDEKAAREIDEEIE